MIGDVSICPITLLFVLLDKSLNQFVRLNVGISTPNKSRFVGVYSQDARDDVGGAQNTGMLGILVKTGAFHSSF